jgi:hypothetical protein
MPSGVGIHGERRTRQLRKPGENGDQTKKSGPNRCHPPIFLEAGGKIQWALAEALPGAAPLPAGTPMRTATVEVWLPRQETGGHQPGGQASEGGCRLTGRYRVPEITPSGHPWPTSFMAILGGWFLYYRSSS